jgi:hypothetical protein
MWVGIDEERERALGVWEFRHYGTDNTVQIRSWRSMVWDTAANASRAVNIPISIFNAGVKDLHQMSKELYPELRSSDLYLHEPRRQGVHLAVFYSSSTRP